MKNLLFDYLKTCTKEKTTEPIRGSGKIKHHRADNQRANYRAKDGGREGLL